MQKIKNITIFIACLLICLASSVLFVGCGKTDENEIKLNEVTHSIFYAPLYVAYNLGYFEDEGLKVSIESSTGSDASMTSLLSGSANIVLIGPEQVVYAEGKQDQPVVFGQLTQKDGSFFVGKEDTSEFSLDMLKGKTIIGGREGGLPAMTLQYIIEQAGLTIGTNVANNEVNLRTDVSFPMIGSEFITSGSEYCTLFEPTATNMESEGNGYVLDAVGNYSGYIPYTCFVAKESYLKSHQAQAEKFLKAVYNGYKYITTQKLSDVARALQPSFSGMTANDLEIAARQYVAIDAWSSDFILEEDSFNTMVEIVNSTHGKKHNVSYNPDYSKLVNTSIARNLLANA